ncbi:hypothetical protein C1Y40_05245 [Mycobacterium talmoniae]|uniref:Uncharacterized protein n=1 Tax=Mycobacterium talmoniae TaxID=1858794 RepID=A0A2S8BD53_9MYCO|nr:hypothetical protein C1Y40_05245 [Mycobacterium talmoniae]
MVVRASLVDGAVRLRASRVTTATVAAATTTAAAITAAIMASVRRVSLGDCWNITGGACPGMTGPGG